MGGDFSIWLFDGYEWRESENVFFDKVQDAIDACHPIPSDAQDYMFGIQQNSKWVAFVFEGQVGWIMDKETVY